MRTYQGILYLPSTLQFFQFQRRQHGRSHAGEDEQSENLTKY